MTWIVWRLHRAQAATGVIVLAVLGVVLGFTGLVMHHDYQQALSTCSAAKTCVDLPNSLFQGDGLIIDTVVATMALPLILGIFWGAPLVASEFETGTGDLAWTQGITRRRWITTNLLQSLLVAAGWGGAITLLVSWWRQPQNAMNGALPAGAFDIQGIAPIAYSIFAMALGVTAGVLWRRTLTAIGTTLVGFVAVRVIVLQFVRSRYLRPLTRVASLTAQSFPISGRAWLISKHVATPAGMVVDNKGPISGPGTWVPRVCQIPGPTSADRLTRCLSRGGYHWILRFQPPSRFWTFQAIEGSLFVVLAAGLSALAAHQMLRRDV